MTQETIVLLSAAASLGGIHALLGADHYLPLAALAWERKWSAWKTARVMVLCGTGHVLSSALLGAATIALGASLGRLEALESFRGGASGWVLMGFGLAYGLWGLRKALGRRTGIRPGTSRAAGFLFLALVLGPCEPLLPLLFHPSAHGFWMGAAVTAIFGAATLAAMGGAVLVSLAGMRRLPAASLERWAPALAGAGVLLCGSVEVFKGL